MVVLPCLPFILNGSYLTNIFLLTFVGSLIFTIVRK